MSPPPGGDSDESDRSWLNPLDLIVLTRERLQETLDEAAERGRMTQKDANDLVAELIRRGRQQTEELFMRARRTVGLGASPPIADYDELTARQVCDRLDGLTPAQLRAVREHERRHANRKSVLAAIERALD
jgi:hypothetical protein